MKGRKPKPSANKDLHGTSRADRKTNEAKPDVAIPARPDHLSPAACDEWNRIAPELATHKLLSQLDRAALAAYCTAWGRWIEAEDKIREKGLLIQDTNGHPAINPYLAIADRALKQMREFLVEFGLTPSSRSRIDVGPDSTQPPAITRRVRK